MRLLDLDHLTSLHLGDTFETPGPLSGMCEEPMCWRLVEKTNRAWFFKLTYMGCRAGEVSAEVKNGKLVVEELA